MYDCGNCNFGFNGGHDYTISPSDLRTKRKHMDTSYRTQSITSNLVYSTSVCI